MERYAVPSESIMHHADAIGISVQFGWNMQVWEEYTILGVVKVLHYE